MKNRANYVQSVTSMWWISFFAFIDYKTTVHPCQRHIHFSQDRDLAADNALWSRAKRGAVVDERRRRRRLFVRDEYRKTGLGFTRARVCVLGGREPRQSSSPRDIAQRRHLFSLSRYAPQ